MGLFLSKISQILSNLGSKNSRILLLGLDSAGKTTILYKLKLNENVSTIPTIGFNVEEVTPVRNVTFTVWDLGGQQKLRPLWRQYYYGSEGLIFVVDSSDVSRVLEARDELLSVLNDDAMERGVPCVVLANKQDLPNALTSQDLAEKLGLRDLSSNPWFIQEMCATSGDGLYEGVHMMAEMVKTYKNKKR